MTKSKLIQKTFPGIVILFLLLCQLISCSKDNQNSDNSQIFQVNLTDTIYHDLLHKNGSVVDYGNNIIVGNSGLNYEAADRQCPVCGANKIVFLNQVTFNINYYYHIWECTNCLSTWDATGDQNYTITPVPLKIYTVTQSGNILTVHL
jgi:rubredoxin